MGYSEEITKFVRENCVRSDGRPARHVGNPRWWESSEDRLAALESIKRETAFLGPDFSIGGRIVYIASGRTNKAVCPSCGKPTPEKTTKHTTAQDRICQPCKNRDPAKISKQKDSLLAWYAENRDLHLKRIADGCMAKHGVDHPSKIPAANVKRSESLRRTRRSVWTDEIHAALAPESLAEAYRIHVEEKRTVSDIARELGVDKLTLWRELARAGYELHRWRRSAFDVEIERIFREYDPDASTTRKVIRNPETGRFLELDVYSEKLRVAVEFNGTISHGMTERNRHLVKTEECSKIGVRLIHVDQHLWHDRRTQMERIVRRALGDRGQRIYARKCDIVHLSPQRVREFFDENHLMGFATGSEPVHVGLVHDGEIVCAATFGRRKQLLKHDGMELIRYASRWNAEVVGGLSRLCSQIDEPIISFCDRRWFDGSGFLAAGFELVGVTGPSYYYVNSTTGEVKSRFQCQKHKIGAADGQTELERMNELGFFRVYDCGQLKLIRK